MTVSLRKFSMSVNADVTVIGADPIASAIFALLRSKNIAPILKKAIHKIFIHVGEVNIHYNKS